MVYNSGSLCYNSHNVSIRRWGNRKDPTAARDNVIPRQEASRNVPQNMPLFYYGFYDLSRIVRTVKKWMTAVWWGNCLGCGRGPRTIYQYLAVEQTLFSCELGRYTAFGIAAQKRVPDSWRQIAFVPDICTNAQQAQRLAQLCTQGQLEPIHLMDVIEDFVADPCSWP